MDQTVRDTLRRYLADVPELPNESAKTHRFSALVSELFPGSRVTFALARGIEKGLRIDTYRGTTRRRIDAYVGNAIIEFEDDLKATGSVAEEQLQEYVAGIRQAEGGAECRPLVAIASDGVTWRTYRPILLDGNADHIDPYAVALEPIRTLELTERSLDAFWLWLTGLLFRRSQTEPSAALFRLDFGAESIAFADAIMALRRAWARAAGEPETALKLTTWRRYLTFTYGSLNSTPAELEHLFLKHTYLVSLARLLVWASLSRGSNLGDIRDTAESVFSGKYFRSRQIGNLVDDDFFQWILEKPAADELTTVWERIIAQLLTYNLSRLGQDVLKGVYQELIDPADRHDLGEYYTPEWLCEAIVEEVLPSSGLARVLDPTCGSGSFLRATIVRLREANQSLAAPDLLRRILEGVVGIDVHPVAVTIARATYTLALGSALKSAKRPIQIPVYLADSLFLPREVSQIELGQVPSYTIRFGGDQSVAIPEDVVTNADLFDSALGACADVAADHARTGAESLVSLRAYLARVKPELLAGLQTDQTVSALWEYTTKLAALIRAHRNSIWTFVVRNAYRPAMLRQRFDVIIGNPPWLSYRYITDPQYQAEVKELAVDKYRIAPRSQKLVTQMELATLFLVHSLDVFGAGVAKLAFVMPRSVLSADQHVKLRARDYSALATITGYWDLKEVRPLFNVPACVLFADRVQPEPTATYTIPATSWAGVLPSQDVLLGGGAERIFARSRFGTVDIPGSAYGTLNQCRSAASDAHRRLRATL